jgi:hypothetical protein
MGLTVGIVFLLWTVLPITSMVGMLATRIGSYIMANTNRNQNVYRYFIAD